MPQAPPEFLRAALEWLPIGVLIASADGTIALVNRELERIFGYAGAELIGHPIEILVPDGARSAHLRLRHDFTRQPEARRMAAGRELFGRRKDGAEIPIEVHLTPFSTGESGLVLASIVDLSQRRRVHEESRADRKELQRFELLVGELGAEFANVRPDDVDHTIEGALGRVVRTLDLDRGGLFQLTEAGDFVQTHQWTRPGATVAPQRIHGATELPWHLARVRAGELASFSAHDQVPDPIDRDTLRRLGAAAGITIPLVRGGLAWGAVSFGASRAHRAWPPDLVNRLQVVSALVGHVLTRRGADAGLRRALAESVALRDRLREENAYLIEELKTLSGTSAIVGHSPGIRRVLEQVRQAAQSHSTVLVRGEIGTGKTLFATRIHDLSAQRQHAMVRVNGATASAASIDAVIPGYQPPGNLDAGPRLRSPLELAHGSTLLIDEVGDLSPAAQASLNRLLSSQTDGPVNGGGAGVGHVRVIATTRRDLSQSVTAGAFSNDLYGQLNGSSIDLPPLRERPEDVPLLVWRFVDEFSDAFGKPIDAIDKESMTLLQQHRWPGNARELRGVVERAVFIATARHLRLSLPALGVAAVRVGETLAAVERDHITATLSACGGQIEGRDGAAARLDLSPRALRATMSRLAIPRPH